MRKPRARRPAPESPAGDSGAGRGAPRTGRASRRGSRVGSARAGRELVPRPATGERGEGGLAVFGRRSSEPVRTDRRDQVVSTGLTDRLAERRRANRSLLLRRATGLLSVGIGVALLVWVVAFSPLLALRTRDVAVVGSDSDPDAAAVRDVAAEHEGTSLVRLDVAALGDEVADDLPRVKSAAVTRSWPHGLTVALTMRVPVAQHRTDTGYEVLDGEAVVLETADGPEPGLAEITSDDGAALTQEQVGAVAEAVGSLDETTRAQVASGSATATGQVSLVLTSGSRVVWGDRTDPALKAEVLAVLLGQTASTYDVSSPRSPTTS